MKKQLMLGLSCLVTTFLFAQDSLTTTPKSTNPWHKIEVNIGGYLTDITTEARIGSDALGIGLSVDLEKASGYDHHYLPVPATYLVGNNGVIQFQYANPNYKMRLDPDLLIAAAKSYLKTKGKSIIK